MPATATASVTPGLPSPVVPFGSSLDTLAHHYALMEINRFKRDDGTRITYVTAGELAWGVQEVPPVAKVPLGWRLFHIRADGEERAMDTVAWGNRAHAEEALAERLRFAFPN